MDATPQNLTAEDLLRHAGWIRGLAASLVADPNEVDDLVQETWLAALKHPPVVGGNPATWLARVLKNAAGQRRRSEGRRVRREAEVAEAREGDPGPDGVLGRFELQRELSDLVASLGEPYRTAVLLRYYEGLSGAEIARRLGVAAGTVRWRLKEGLGRLRGQLDDRHGERGVWCALLTPLARPVAPALPTPSTPGPLVAALQGVLTMKLALKAALALPLLAVTLVALNQIGILPLAGRGDLPPEEPVAVSFRPLVAPAEPERTPEPVSRSTRSEVVEPVDPDEAEQAAVEAAPTVVLLRFLDEGGAPLHGVRCEPGAWVRARFGVSAGEQSASGPDGRLRLELRQEEGWGEDSHSGSLFECGGTFLAARTVETVLVPGRVNDLGDLRLSPGGAVSGRVLDGLGQPLEGIWVRTIDELPRARDAARTRRTLHGDERGVLVARTDAGGGFLLEGVETGFAHLAAGGEGWLATYSAPVEVRAGQESFGVELVLEPLEDEDLIEGIVVDPEGNPVPRATLEIRFRTLTSSGSGTQTVGADGRFRLVLARRAPRDLRAWSEGYRAAFAEGVEPGTRDLVLQLGEPRHVELLVRTADGSEPQGLGVVGFDPERRDVLVAPGEPRFEGGVVRIPLPVEEFILDVRAEGFDVTVLGPFQPEDVPERLECELRPLPGIRGRVLSGGAPLAVARLSLLSPARHYTTHNDLPSRLEPASRGRGESDAQGNFALTVREEGPFVLLVEAPGHGTLEHGPFEFDPRVGLADLELELGPGGAIEGRVLVAPGLSPAGIVVAVNRGDCRARTQRVGGDGMFRFEHLTPGPWQVTRVAEELVEGSSSSFSSSSADLAEVPADCHVVEGDTTWFDLEQGGAGGPVLRGSLMVDGRAPGAWKASLIEARPGAVQVAGDVSCTLDIEGRFRLSPPRPGTWRLLLESPGGSGPTLLLFEELELGPEGLEWSAAIETGSVRIANVLPDVTRREGVDLPTPLAEVLVWKEGNLTGLILLAGDEGGLCQLDRVPAGRVQLARLPFAELMEASTPPESWPTVLELDVEAGEQVLASLP